MTLPFFDITVWLAENELPVIDEPTPAKIPGSRPAHAPRESSHADRMRRAALYLAQIDGAVSHDGGHDATFDAACSMVNNFGCSVEETFKLLWTEFNQRCDPPWTESEIRHKVEDAAGKSYEKPNGWMLRESCSRDRASATAGAPPEDREEIIIGTDAHRVIDQAEWALAIDPNAYQRGRLLVMVTRERLPTPEPGVFRCDPQIGLMTPPHVWELLSKNAAWKTEKQDKDGASEKVPILPPNYAAHTLMARRGWANVRPLKSVTNSPFMRPDGSIVSDDGYDVATAILLEPNADFVAVPSRPCQGLAEEAAKSLLAIVENFPFKAQTHKAAWLAALLSPFARHAVVDEAFPLFLFDANTRGSGKTKLADIISIIKTGSPLARSVFPSTEDEMRKRMTAVALAGKSLVLLDNIPAERALGGESLETVLTGTTWEDRVLGVSELVSLPMYAVWYATGNNIQIKGDNLRRIVYSRLQSMETKPEERPATDFAHPSLIGWLHENRPRFVRDALTILRAFHDAGRPQPSPALTAMDYPGWCGLVRNAVHWATGIDPCLARRELDAADTDSMDCEALVHGWNELPGGATGLTASVALTHVHQNPELFQRLRDVLMRMSRGPDLPSAVAVGKKLKAFEGRVFNGKRIASDCYQGVKDWRVEDAARDPQT